MIQYCKLQAAILRNHILVQDQEESTLKSLVIKARIPRFVYKAEENMDYVSVENSGAEAILDTSLYIPSSSLSSAILLPSRR